MAGNPQLFIEVAGDDSKLRKTLKRSETETKRWASRLEGISAGTALGGRGGLASSSALLKGGGFALGAGIATQKIMELTDAASALNEQQTKSQVVFGASARSIEKWSDTTAVALGISKRAALEASGTFGQLFHTVGIGNEQASTMSKRLVKLASDLASFNNADPSEVLDAIRSGLIGEAEPMRRFGARLSEARVQTLALAETGKTNARALTEQEKALARYQIILQDTKIATNDYQNTQGSLANQQRKLGAQSEDLQGKLGKVLLPVVTALVTQLNEGATAAGHVGNALDETDKKSDGFLFGALKAVGKWQLLMSPVGPTIAGIKLLNALLDDSTKKFTELDAIAQKMIEDTTGAFNLNPSNIPDLSTRLGGRKGGPPAFGEPGFKPGGAPPVPVVPIELQNRWFDSDITRRLDKVQDIATIKGQIAALTEIAGLIKQRIAVTNDITRTLSLEDQLRAVRRQQRSLGEQLLADAAEAKRVAKARAEEAAAIRLQQRTARQFRELGLSATGEPVTPGVDNLRKRVASITDRIADTKLDTPKLRTQLARFRKVLAEGLVPKDVRARIKEMLDDINDQLGQNAKQGGPLTKTTQLNTERILAGLGLGRDAERMIRARLSHFNTAGTALTGAGAGSVNVMVPVTVTVDGKQIAKTSSKYQRRGRKVNPSQRNGPNAGLIIP